MRLCIKQRVFAWTDTYDVYDDSGEARYYVEAEFFTFGHQIHVYDKRSGQEVGAVHQKLFAFMPEFEIVIGGRTVGTIRKEFSFYTPKYHVDFRGWDVEGDMLHWDYEVYDRGRTVMYISKEWLTWGDTYTLSYDDVGDEIPGLLLVIAIDAVNCSKNK